MATATALGSQQVPTSADKHTFCRPELEVLRFFAFFSIFISNSLSHDPADYVRYHVPEKLAALAATIASAGRFGYQLFFVLSGYLITVFLLRERWTKGDINLRAFYIRRALRVLPLYLLVLLGASIWQGPAHLPLPYLGGYLVLAGNWMTAFWGAPPSWASVLWSVALISQFYALWPLAVKFLSRNARLYVSLSLIVVANLTRLYLAVGSLHSYTVFPNTFAELDAIGVGVLCALSLKAAVPVFSAAQRMLLMYSGIVLLLGCGYLGRSETPLFVLGGYPVVVAGCLAIFLGMCGTEVKWKPFVYLGSISYGLYVFHLLALRLVGMALGGKAGSPGRFFIYWTGGF